MVRSSWRWFFLIVLAIAAGYWKLAFPSQFSLLTGYESANQAYAWNNFFASSLHHGSLPLWDPFGHAGRTLIGEMQTGTFYPPKLLLYVWPFDSAGRLSARFYHWFYLLTAVAGAWFMFRLAREIGLREFPAYFAAVTFVVGGFVGRIVWPHLHDGAIWLPLVLFFIARAMRARGWRASLQYACAAGLAMGITVLSGALHLVIMQAMAVTGLLVYFAARKDCPALRAAAILATTGVICAVSGAVQILPSMEYSPLAFRFLGAFPTTMSNDRIPYGYLANNYLPRALWGFLAGYPFAGGSIGTEEIYPYFGILPLLAAIAGVWRNWVSGWVRYLAALAVLALYYTLGDYSLLHGILYTVVPRLWMAREPGRFIYLVHFALALLAGFGVQTLFESDHVREIFHRPLQVLGWIVALIAAILTIPAFTGQTAPEWGYLAFLQILLAFCLLLAVIRAGWNGPGARFLLVALALGDLAIFNLTIRDTKTLKDGENHLQVLQDSKAMCDFLKSQPGLFRVHFDAEWAPSIGEVYGVYTTGGMAATSLRDFQLFTLTVPHSLDMLGVRYIIRSSSAPQPGFVYADKRWKVYETGTTYFPRAWMVGQVAVEQDAERTYARLKAAGFDPARMAVSAEALEMAADTPATIPAEIAWNRFDINRIEMTVRAPSPGLLVVAETYYPGWRASVDGRETPIHKVNNVFRGVVLPKGESRVVLSYRPRSVYAGGVLTLLCFAGVIVWFAASRPSEAA
jgi:hypothetical protein